MNRTMRQLLRDMGFGGGFGTGASGAGDGFGAERGGGNVGLYGSLPGMTSLEDARGGTGGGGGNGKGGSGTGMDFETESYEAGAEGTVSGTAEGTVPLRYRQAVGRYFQRILEESIP